MDNDRHNWHERELPAPRTALGYRMSRADFAGAEELSLQACSQILRRRCATIFSVAAIITVLAALYAFKTKPVYRGTAKLEVDADSFPLQQARSESSQTSMVSDDYLQTQVGILKSDALAWQAITQFGLENGGEFDPSGEASAGSALLDARRHHSQILTAFEKHLDVRLAPGSHILLVSFEDADPNLAEQVPNALVDHYLEYNFTARYDSTRQVSDWMAKELDNLKQKVVTSQQALVNYEKQNDMTDLADQGDLEQAALDDLSRQLTAAQTDLAAKRALFDAVKQNPSAAGLLTKDSLLSSLQGKYGDLETDYAKALAEYGPSFYKVVQIRRQIDEVNSLMRQQQKREQAQAQADYLAAAQRVAILARAVNERRAAVQTFNQLQIPYTILKNEYQTNQQLYQSLLARLKNAEISAGLKATNIHVLDRALFPVAPIRPQKAVDIAVGLLSGLLVGLTLAFVQEALDTSVKRPEELESVIGAPILGVIPRANGLGHGGGWLSRGKRQTHALAERCVLQWPRSPIAESYRTLRTSILLFFPSEGPRVLLFTSTQPREGKTSTCVNLAAALAQLNRRVLLMDADLRRGQMQEIFQLPPAGLSDVLAGSVPHEAVLRQVEDAPGLRVLSSGSRPASPADLLSTPMMEDLMRELRRDFEFIIIDSPPLLLVADASILSQFADGIILVTSSEMTARRAVSRALGILGPAGEKLLGAVVNRVDGRRDNDYGYYRRHRRYYSRDAADSASVSPSSFRVTEP